MREFGLTLGLAAAEYEREQCCKDICPRCQATEGLRRTPDGVWAHVPFAFEVTEHGTIVEPEGVPCDAARIRERAWKEENESNNRD
jgi:ribosomal protein L37AE/L43A